MSSDIQHCESLTEFIDNLDDKDTINNYAILVPYVDSVDIIIYGKCISIERGDIRLRDESLALLSDPLHGVVIKAEDFLRALGAISDPKDWEGAWHD